ncbi:GGDEF domain-containing protein [Duganella sp. BJB475]|nr:GGDEF domain-containing protein [Duganella sp. BJB475]RFP35388.1 GGDEF domain-containing protein [Duganella sp. BJB476]
MRDPLTGLVNRRGFDEQAVLMAANATLHNRPLALLALDLDHFKRVNDTYGHLAGDRVLAAVADAERNTLRDSDLPARLGGEEFAVLLPDVPAEAAWQAAERIRKAIGAMAVQLDDGQALTQTVSIGIAMFNHGDADLQATQGRADAALYRAKASGRNCCAADDAG